MKVTIEFEWTNPASNITDLEGLPSPSVIL
jgi:hypothetical protein